MNENVEKQWISILIISTVILSGIVIPLTTMNELIENVNDNLGSIDISAEAIVDRPKKSLVQAEESVFDMGKGLEKIPLSLRKIISEGGKKTIKVIIPTTNINELATTLSKYNYIGHIGTRSTQSRNANEIVFPVLEIPTNSIAEILSLSSVIGIYEYKDISQVDKGYDLNKELEYEGRGIMDIDPWEDICDSNNPIKPQLAYATARHGAYKAWENGFTGKGVKIGIVDTGVDFAHPDLYGTQARVSILTIENETVITAKGGEKWAYLAHGNIVASSYTIYKNYVPITEGIANDYTLDLTTGNISFISPLVKWDNITAYYHYYPLYYGWPIAFDPASMSTYLSTELSDGTWYANTTSTDTNVSHTINIDGTDDFWLDPELVGGDYQGSIHPEDMQVPDFDLYKLFVTQDANNWYIGFDTYANTRNMTFGIYMDTDQKKDSGANNTDPLGNYINATGWDESKGSWNAANATHLPEYVIYINHTGTLWGCDKEGSRWTKNDTIGNATLFKWSDNSWAAQILTSLGGQQAYSGYKNNSGVWYGFIELLIPKAAIGNPANISLELFTAGQNKSHAQDTCPKDPNVNFVYPDWSNTTTTLNAFTTVGYGFWSNPTNEKNKSWRPYYILPETSKSGVYHIGFHPDENTLSTMIVKVLVVDEVEAGVYDTVYIDLDADKDFTNEKPCRLYGAYNDSLSIGPSFGTILFDNRTLYHNGLYYEIYDNNTIYYEEEYCNITFYDEISYWDKNNDGFADVSGGMIYFIADNKTPIPYSNVYCNRYGIETNVIPKNGELVCFIGEFSKDAKAGTRHASIAVGQGNTYVEDKSHNKFHEVVGPAPNATIIPVINTNIFDAWYFAVEGYDGLPGTGDEANIATTGISLSSVYESGWDLYSRFIDWLSIIYAEGKTVFVSASGDFGPGYGTITSPGSSPGVITVGTSTDYGYRVLTGDEYGPTPTWGDVSIVSGRGPTMLGGLKPNVVAAGQFSFYSEPLWCAGGDGAVACDVSFGRGTAFSAMVVTGILSLIYDAYYQVHSEYPDATTAREILMSGADNLNYDALSQGAGFSNADRSTKIANEMDGILTTPTFWVPGDYRGKEYEGFVKLMHSGENRVQEFNISNMDQVNAATVEITDAVFQKIDEWSYSFTTIEDFSGLSSLSWVNDTGIYTYDFPSLSPKKVADGNSVSWKNAELCKLTAYTTCSNINQTMTSIPIYGFDLYKWTDNGDEYPWYKHDMNRITQNFAPTNVMEVRVHDPYHRTADGLVTWIRPYPYWSPAIPGMNWTLKVEFYNKTNWNWLSTNKTLLSLNGGASTTFNATMTLPPTTPIGSYEGAIYVNRIVTNEIVIDNAAGTETYAPLQYHNLIANSYTIFKNGAEWPEDSGNNYTIDIISGNVTFPNSLNPGDTITATYAFYHSAIPVLVNVPSSKQIPKFTFGGNTSIAQEMYNNSRIYAGFGAGGKSGDWRFFYFDVPEQGLYENPSEGTRLFVDTKWDYINSDVDVFAFGKISQPKNPITSEGFPSERYGPYALTNLGGSEETTDFFTTTGGAEEIVAPCLSSGLSVIALHTVRLNGTANFENVSGEVGTLNANPSSLNIVTNELSGKRGVEFYSSSNWEGIGGIAAGPSAPEKYENVEILHDTDAVDAYMTGQISFQEALCRGSYTKIVTLQKSCLIFDVHITSDPETTQIPCDDLDLGVFLDGLGDDNEPDGMAQEEEFIAYCADADADEEVKLIKPTVIDDPDTPDINEETEGTPYIIKVLGFTVPGKGTLNIDITLVQGEGFGIEGEQEDIAPEPSIFKSMNLIPSNTVSTLSLTWNFPGNTEDSTFMGALYIGPANAPMCLLVPIELTIDRSAPTISSFQLIADPEDPNLRVNYLDNSTTNDNMPTLSIQFTDATTTTKMTLEHIAPEHLWGCTPEHWTEVTETIEVDRGELDPSSIKMYIDGIDITAWANVKVPFYEKDPDGIQNSGDEVYGYWIGMTVYKPPIPLLDGGHAVELKVSDLAGNIATAHWTFTIDTQAPSLIIDTPSTDISTNVNVTTISGTTTPGSTLFIRGKEIEVKEDGSFSKEERLEEGINEIPITAVDWFDWDDVKGLIPGNTATITRVITLDTTKPQFSRITTSTTSITNKDSTTIIGKIEDERSEDIILTVNDILTAVNSDGTFMATLLLEEEGENEINIIATDPAGNTNETSMTIVKDTIKPILTIEDLSPNTQGVLNIKGTTETGATITINGKPMPVVNGAFNKEIDLSYGPNLIVIESKDAAGNIQEVREVVMYSSMPVIGFLPLSLISMIVLLLIGLFVGYVLLSRTKFGKKIEEEEVGDEVREGELEKEEPEEELEAEEEIEKEEEAEEEEMGKESEEEKEIKEETSEKDLEELGKELFGED